MKYLFIAASGESSRTRSLIDSILQPNIKIDFWNSGTFYGIYDDVKNEISYYNSVSKDKCKAYPAISFTTSHITSTAILQTIKRDFTISVSEGSGYFSGKYIIEGIMSNNNDSFVNAISESNIDNPAIFSLTSTAIFTNNNPALFKKLDNNLINFRFVAMKGRSINEHVKKIDYLQLIEFEIKDPLGFLGCSIEEYIKEMKEHDMSSMLKKRFAENKIQNDLFEGPILNIVSIRNGDEQINIPLNIFLTSIDCTRRLFDNNIKTLVEARDQYIGSSIKNRFSFDPDSLFADGGRSIISLDAAIDFRNVSYNIY